MSQEAEVKIVLDSSLLEYFNNGLQKIHSNSTAEHEITRLLAMILNHSEYPVSAKRTAENEIKVFYHLRSFSEPVF